MQELGVNDSYWDWENIQAVPLTVIEDFAHKILNRRFPSDEKEPSQDTLTVLQELVDDEALPPKAHAAAISRLKK